MKHDDSIYRLFEDLPRFVEKPHPPLEDEKIMPTIVSVPIKDEADLFREAMKDVRRLSRGNARVSNPPHFLEPAQQPSPQTDRRMLENILDESYRFNIVDLPEYMEGYSKDISPLTLEKLRKGEFSVQKVLDLHGFGAQEAELLFEAFLRDAIRSNLRCVKVIHGRGLKSKSGPVLKEKLKDWIMRAMHRKWITGFSSAQMREGGPGATNILLKKQPTKKGFRIVG